MRNSSTDEALRFLDEEIAREEGLSEELEAQEWKPSLADEIDYLIPFPGVARDIQKWILDTSIRQQPAIALAATMALMATCAGRYINANGIKGNIMAVCIAGSSEGKDHPLKSVSRILDSIGLSDCYYSQMASGAALVDSLDRSNSMIMVIDEIGHYFSGISGKNAGTHSKEIMPMLTEIYTCSNDSYKEKTRKGMTGRVIHEPNLSLVGFSTEKQILSAMSANDLEDGSLGRFFFFFGGVDVRRNRGRIKSKEIPDRITDALIKFKPRFIKEPYSSNDLELSDEYQSEIEKIEDHFDEIAFNSDDKNKKFAPFYKRMAVKAIQMALLIDGCQDIEVLKWCAKMCHDTTEIFIKKFNHFVANGAQEVNFKDVERAIKEAGKKGISKRDLLRKTQNLRRTDRNSILADMLETGLIFEKQSKIEGSQRVTTLYFWKK